MNTNQLGQLQLIKLSDDDEYIKYETDIRMVVSDEKDIFFVFDFNFEKEETKAKVIIDNSCEKKVGMVAFGTQVVDFGESGFVINFSLCDEEKEEGSFFICAARFETTLPKIGFIKQLLYYFDFDAHSH